MLLRPVLQYQQLRDQSGYQRFLNQSGYHGFRDQSGPQPACSAMLVAAKCPLCVLAPLVTRLAESPSTLRPFKHMCIVLHPFLHNILLRKAMTFLSDSRVTGLDFALSVSCVVPASKC